MINLPLSTARVALLATGDEITNGDILNTNGQKIAHILKNQGFSIHTHVVVDDDEENIKSALEFLWNANEAIILTGGLGPTSDDKTRFALSKFLQKPLQFDANSWNQIIDRLTRFNFQIHESNKQQAFFPEGAQILPNSNGTANGCLMSIDNKIIAMLPGPPLECLTMFEMYVLPALLQQSQHQKFFNSQWLLFGIAESEIAAKLDELLSHYPLTTGYRLDYPYLEFKIRTLHKEILPEIKALIEHEIGPYSIAPENKKASDYLKELISHCILKIYIQDEATKGLLQYTLTSAETNNQLHFVNEHFKPQKTDFYIQIKGLNELWQINSKAQMIEFEMLCHFQDIEKSYKAKAPFISTKVNFYVVELICHFIANFIVEFVYTNTTGINQSH